MALADALAHRCHAWRMKKFSLLISLSLLGLPAAAMDKADFEAYSKCKEGVERMDYAEQYDLGKFFAQA